MLFKALHGWDTYCKSVPRKKSASGTVAGFNARCLSDVPGGATLDCRLIVWGTPRAPASPRRPRAAINVFNIREDQMENWLLSRTREREYVDTCEKKHTKFLPRILFYSWGDSGPSGFRPVTECHIGRFNASYWDRGCHNWAQRMRNKVFD